MRLLVEHARVVHGAESIPHARGISYVVYLDHQSIRDRLHRRGFYDGALEVSSNSYAIADVPSHRRERCAADLIKVANYVGRNPDATYMGMAASELFDTVLRHCAHAMLAEHAAARYDCSPGTIMVCEDVRVGGRLAVRLHAPERHGPSRGLSRTSARKRARSLPAHAFKLEHYDGLLPPELARRVADGPPLSLDFVDRVGKVGLACSLHLLHELMPPSDRVEWRTEAMRMLVDNRPWTELYEHAMRPSPRPSSSPSSSRATDTGPASIAKVENRRWWWF
jgi:hypothetical protein